MVTAIGLDRRQFLRISASACGGLIVATVLPACGRSAGAPPVAERFNTFLVLDTAGNVSITIPVPEIGQGVRTSLAMLVADELETDWERIRVVQADAGDDLGPWPMAGASNSVRAYWTPLREVGAAAREALIAVAARRFEVSPSECVARHGYVDHPPTGGRLAYGELASEAAREPVPNEIRLKDPSEFRIIGTRRRNLDAWDICNGSIAFGLDTRVPGMLRAVIARPPSYGGSPRSWDDSGALATPGVRAVVKVEPGGSPDRPAPRGGVAVIADSTWAALKGRQALTVDWDPGPNAGESSERLHVECRDLLRRRADTYREAGDVDRALQRSARVVTAEYHAPFLAHVSMEPMNCVVDLSADRCQIWVPTQVPNQVRAEVARLLEFPEDAVIVHVTRSGGGFGRRLLWDFVLEAVPLARNAGVPVQLVWTREDDIRHGHLRPFSYHRFEAGLDSAGSLTAWLHRQAGTSRYAFQRRPSPGRSEFTSGTWPAALAPAHRLEYALANSNMPLGSLRAPGFNSLACAVECFLDEVAHTAGTDPLSFRLTLLAPAHDVPNDRDNPIFSTGRMRGVLDLAAERAGWGRSLPAGSGLGVACCFAFGSYAAHIVEVAADASTGAIQVRRVFSAIDCGRAVNPNGLEAQLEGAVMDGLSAALYGEVTIDGASVQQSNFHDYQLLRFSRAPEVDVAIVRSEHDPTGAGEVGYPPVAPALANAVFAACGARVRQFPLSPERLRERA